VASIGRVGRVTAEEELATFVGRFLPEIAAVCEAALTRMRARLPGTFELVYDNYNALAIGFSPTERTSDGLFSIAVFPRVVRLFFLSGASLDDPSGVLEGQGRQVRSVQLPNAGIIDTPAVSELMDQAISRGIPWDHTRPSSLAIRSVSAKQRPRRPSS
jgi:hypothetical protein